MYTIKQDLRSSTWQITKEDKLVGVTNDKYEADYWASKIEAETAPLHAEIARLQAENAKLCKFVQDVRDLEAVIAARTVIGEDASESFWDGLNQVNEAKAFMYDKWKEESQELLDELEESEADNA